MLHSHGTTPANLSAKDIKVLIVASRWNQELTDVLVSEAQALFLELGGAQSDITIIRVPGAFEIPFAIDLALAEGEYDAAVALGVIIEGATPHFDKLCNDSTEKVSSLILAHQTPIGFGVVMAHTLEQAQQRCVIGEGSKGRESLAAAVEMAQLKQTLLRQKV